MQKTITTKEDNFTWYLLTPEQARDLWGKGITEIYIFDTRDESEFLMTDSAEISTYQDLADFEFVAEKLTASACPHCDGLHFSISESYIYKADIDPDTGELGRNNSPQTGGYDLVTCTSCKAEFPAENFNIN